ncbi:hypothetical protein SBF1_320018 [Candidatus Desulfosporosinus infrequens]|uniref:Uncharacterized protein n=1 Tax=Candidatus Desulfosporosinus infrequens TaxID=2043169 RepID=A0A2U3KZJ7_9FIRM|nr:hypothetical protein SBF1_320018 [Candidatus Desulfosporosinus infrequens]
MNFLLLDCILINLWWRDKGTVLLLLKTILAREKILMQQKKCLLTARHLIFRRLPILIELYSLKKLIQSPKHTHPKNNS